MKYLLDTCTVSDFVKGQAGVLSRIKATAPPLIAISSITRMEIEWGLLLNPARARKLAPILNTFLDSITTLSFDEADAQAAAGVRAALQRQGQPIGAYDVLIAGCGLARGLIVVTSNVSEFQRVSGLIVENWR
ncbi:MAG TPA: type II toxin-antitoxin system VapC family toxin [Candidatus Competibacteraceae bacterium]|nr:type II toxin-antitoxin system VapC family toxin [Candidatus Competibacteraceae bacterium]HRZ07223.1 type II toxin-antitoxin system VapC family toxin [Candidatus Competibacteraceae bacterium]HSA45694.1 type II toxin-antitoxin system VapC family toxin [Candidatus Competibacteraceae bacterium]